MKKISILVPKMAVIEAVADPNYIFKTVNRFREQAGMPPVFAVETVGLEKNVMLENGLFTVNVDKLTGEVEETDLIVIPAMKGDLDAAIDENRGFLPWIRSMSENGAEVASLCIGAFLLAETGLLDGRKCSTHWIFADEFRRRFPRVDLVDDRIITEENGVYSSGGATSYWNLLLYLVEKFTDRETAVLISKFFAIDIDRDSQSAFILFNGQKDHNDEEVKQAQEYIEQNFEEKINVENLAGKFAVGRRSFERRFKKATNNSIIEYAQRVKIEAAKREFERSAKNVNEVMFDVGYSDNKAFRSVFKKITGLTPVEYRKKFSKIAEAAGA